MQNQLLQMRQEQFGVPIDVDVQGCSSRMTKRENLSTKSWKQKLISSRHSICSDLKSPLIIGSNGSNSRPCIDIQIVDPRTAEKKQDEEVKIHQTIV
jgi:hypothetical protein